LAGDEDSSRWSEFDADVQRKATCGPDAAGYVSLFVLAKQQGRHFRAVKKELEAADVKPALDPETVGATFFRRSEIRTAP
jgi:hypothetical protein